MKVVRFLVFFLLGVVWSSCWWAAAMWGGDFPKWARWKFDILWVAALDLTVFLIFLGVIYCIAYWDGD